MKLNECDFGLRIGETTEAEDGYRVATAVDCPDGKSLQVEVYPFAGSELGGVACTVAIEPQEGVAGPTLSNVEGGDLEIEGAFKGLSIDASGFGCATESSEAEWHIEATVTGTDESEEEEALAVVEAAVGEVAADGPVVLDGTELEKSNALTALGTTIECPESSWAGTKYEVSPFEAIPVNSISLTIVPTYDQSECTAVEGETVHRATVIDNGCDFGLRIGETSGAESSYRISTAVDCPEGKNVQANVYAFSASELGGVICTYSIGSQEGLTGPTLSNEKGGDLKVEGTFEGVGVERSGSGCSTESTEVAKWDFNATAEGASAEEKATEVELVDQS